MQTFDGYVVGAYAASAAHQQWNPQWEEEFFGALVTDPRLGALELPWLGSLHPHDDAWLLRHFPRNLRAVITAIPSTMTRLSVDPLFGLASPDPEGRKAALGHAAEIRDGVRTLNDAQGRNVVGVVELHSGPRGCASRAALSQSLAEIVVWDWDGASLVIEHCDAYVPGQQCQKGFLTLTDEIAALHDSGTNVGLSLNWGRSAIEVRNAERVVEHATIARESGLLHGVIFSGASDLDSPMGGSWVDAHHPFKKNERHPWGITESLLTEPRVKEFLVAAGTLLWSGVKVGWPASVEGSPLQRQQMISDALDALDRAKR